MFNSLFKKILITFAGIVLMSSFLFAGIAIYEVRETAMGQMENDGRAMAAFIRQELLDRKVTDMNRISGQFSGLKQASNGNLLYISLSDSRSNVVPLIMELPVKRMQLPEQLLPGITPGAQPLRFLHQSLRKTELML